MAAVEERATSLIGRDCRCRSYRRGYVSKGSAMGRVMAIVVRDGEEFVDVWTENAGRQFYPRDRVTIHRTSIRSEAGAAEAPRRRRRRRR